MLNPDDWFDLIHLPAGTVRVRVRWPGFEVPAVSSVDAKGRRHWHELRGRELVPLKARPEAWQPMAGSWIWPNNAAPQPLPVRVMGSVVSIGKVAFDAAAAAEEMERDREEARGRRDPAPAEDGGQWWRDVARVAYEPQGNVSRVHGEARIMRALILERSIRMDGSRYRTNAAVLAALKAVPDDYREPPTADWVPPLVSMPEDHKDFETVMGWIVELLPSRREIFVLRARMLSPPATWVQIGDEIHRTAVRAKQIYGETIDALVAAGNREPRRALARRAELQERNREAKRA